MKILVIGNGFIGSKVSHALFKKGHKVTIFDIKKDKKDKQIKFILGILEIYKLYQKQFLVKK